VGSTKGVIAGFTTAGYTKLLEEAGVSLAMVRARAIRVMDRARRRRYTVAFIQDGLRRLEEDGFYDVRRLWMVLGDVEAELDRPCRTEEGGVNGSTDFGSFQASSRG